MSDEFERRAQEESNTLLQRDAIAIAFDEPYLLIIDRRLGDDTTNFAHIVSTEQLFPPDWFDYYANLINNAPTRNASAIEETLGHAHEAFNQDHQIKNYLRKKRPGLDTVRHVFRIGHVGTIEAFQDSSHHKAICDVLGTTNYLMLASYADALGKMASIQNLYHLSNNRPVNDRLDDKRVRIDSPFEVPESFINYLRSDLWDLTRKQILTGIRDDRRQSHITIAVESKGLFGDSNNNMIEDYKILWKNKKLD